LPPDFLMLKKTLEFVFVAAFGELVGAWLPVFWPPPPPTVPPLLPASAGDESPKITAVRMTVALVMFASLVMAKCYTRRCVMQTRVGQAVPADVRRRLLPAEHAAGIPIDWSPCATAPALARSDRPETMPQ
jgi:hypothetical protein